MARSLILACGNPLRGDDGVAWQIAELLQGEFSQPQLEIRCAQQWTPEMAEAVSRSNLTIFVDSSAATAPGEIKLETLHARAENPSPTTHDCSPAILLALARELYQSVPRRALLLTIGGQSYEHGEQLSPIVRDALPAACERIRALLQE
jgi:hydrogenase maturation protease